MMNRSLLNLGLVVSLMTAFVSGCSESSSPPVQSPSPSPQPQQLVARLHWLGMKRLATESNATNFMAIWSAPESAKLEAQTLDKLSTAPWRLLQTATPLSNAPTALLRPLLDDLMQEESYVEVRAATNQPGELILAIRLDARRAALWQTNLPTILKSLLPTQSPDATPLTPSAEYRLQTSARSLALSRAGNWTLLSVSDLLLNAQESSMLANFRDRIQRNDTPIPTRATNYWLEAEMDALRFNEVAGLEWKLPASFPQISLTVTGDGQNVRTRGELNFNQPLPASLEPWRVPLNLTAEPLTGLTVMRSVTPLLERLGILSPDEAQGFPGQFLVWLRSGPPLQIYFAYPTPDATTAFHKLAVPVMDWVNSHSDPRRYGAIVRAPHSNELKWTGLSLCSPFLQAGTNGGNQYLQGGFGLTPPGKVRLPTELHDHITQATNLVYFDWDFTAETLPQWRYLDDVSRMIFDEAHASRLRAATTSIEWLLSNVTNLSHSVTEIRQSNATQLVLTRKSTLGLSAVELDILFNWIELPNFPSGMSTLWRTNPAPFVPVRLTTPRAIPAR